MDGKIYYQVILINTETDTYEAANGNGATARKFKTLWEAEDDCANWALMFQPLPHLRLGVHEVRSTPMPGSKPISHYAQGT